MYGYTPGGTPIYLSIYIHISRVGAAGLKNYITLEEHLNILDSPEKNGNNASFVVPYCFKYEHTLDNGVGNIETCCN